MLFNACFLKYSFDMLVHVIKGGSHVSEALTVATYIHRPAESKKESARRKGQEGEGKEECARTNGPEEDCREEIEEGERRRKRQEMRVQEDEQNTND
jgi:hypothetical protein